MDKVDTALVDDDRGVGVAFDVVGRVIDFDDILIGQEFFGIFSSSTGKFLGFI